MSNIIVPICLALVLTMASSSSLATYLNNPTYNSAKAAYEKGDWDNAYNLLEQYMGEDYEFLFANPKVEKAISKAISYCIANSKNERLRAEAKGEAPFDSPFREHISESPPIVKPALP